MNLYEFLGWPYYILGFIVLAGFTATSLISNVSLIYTEAWHQWQEIKRLRNGKSDT